MRALIKYARDPSFLAEIALALSNQSGGSRIGLCEGKQHPMRNCQSYDLCQPRGIRGGFNYFPEAHLDYLRGHLALDIFDEVVGDPQ